MYLALRCAADRNPDNFYVQWEGELLVGTFRIASHVLALDGVRGHSVTLVYPDGTTRAVTQSIIARPLLLHAMRRQEAQRTILANLKRDKRFADIHIRFLEAYAPAPVVTVRFVPATAFASAGDALRLVFGDVTRYEGIALRVVDASGRFVRFAGIANQTGVSFRTDPK